MATDDQKDFLHDPQPDKLDTMLGEHVADKSPPPEKSSTALADLRSQSLQVDAATLKTALADYDERRKTFRDWLLSKLVRGVHYGYPPGTEPKYNEQGEQLVWSKGSMKVLPRESWTLKESLYEAGADFICELMDVRMVVNADQDLWTQSGAMAGNLCFRCQIISKATGEIIGEGHGGAKVSSGNSKTDPLNQAIMMGRKRAKVKAVRDAYALADLFTQDLEDVDHGPANHPSPATNKHAPKDQTRDKRINKGQLEYLKTAWKEIVGGDVGDWKEWVIQKTAKEFNSLDPTQWSLDDLGKCSDALGLPS